jgi:Tfp pilus assembly protein PilV
LGILDKVRGIEAGSQLADLLRLLNPGTELHSVDDEDVQMYQSRTSGACICSCSTMDAPQHAFVLASRRDNPTRLKGADEILAKAAEDRRNGHSDAIAEDGETTSPDAETDMLVKRLNDSIARALKKVQEMASAAPRA